MNTYEVNLSPPRSPTASQDSPDRERERAFQYRPASPAFVVSSFDDEDGGVEDGSLTKKKLYFVDSDDDEDDKYNDNNTSPLSDASSADDLSDGYSEGDEYEGCLGGGGGRNARSKSVRSTACRKAATFVTVLALGAAVGFGACRLSSEPKPQSPAPLVALDSSEDKGVAAGGEAAGGPGPSLLTKSHHKSTNGVYANSLLSNPSVDDGRGKKSFSESASEDSASFDDSPPDSPPDSEEEYSDEDEEDSSDVYPDPLEVEMEADGFFQEDLRYREPLPPLEDLIDKKAEKVRDGADVSWMLDFAVIGNAKSGTTFLKNYLGKQSDEIYTDPKETCRMSNNRTDSIVKFFHDRLEEVGSETKAAFTPDGRRVKTGLKCPKETGTEWALPNYAKYFPNTDFIVTVRHPVTWFQSFYNYRSYGGHHVLPKPKELIGACVDDSPYLCPHTCARIRTENVCTDRANFHHQLSRFGKTPMIDDREREMLRDGVMGVVPTKSRIFLAELGQFIPENKASEHVAEDLSEFLGLEHQLPAIQDLHTHKRSYPDEEGKANFIDICDPEHAEVRKVLVDVGKEAAAWIRDYFLKSPDVYVSSRDEFLNLIDKWGQDPCEERSSERGRNLVEDWVPDWDYE